MHLVIDIDDNGNEITRPLADGELPIQKPSWPLWAKGLKVLRTAEDKGVGDTVYRIIGPANSAAFQKWYVDKFGVPCGCNERHEQWNTKYPYI